MLVIRDLNSGSRAVRFVYLRSRGGRLSLARSFHLGLLINFTPSHGVTVTVLSARLTATLHKSSTFCITSLTNSLRNHIAYSYVPTVCYMKL